MQLKTVSKWLVVLGAIDLGLMALGFDLLGTLFGSIPMLIRVIYILVGAAGVWGAYAMATNKKSKKRR